MQSIYDNNFTNWKIPKCKFRNHDMGVIRIWRRVVCIPCRGGTEQRWQHLYWDNLTNLPSPAHTQKLFKNNRSNWNRNQFPFQLKLGPQRLKLHLWVCNCSSLNSCFSPPGRWNQLPSLCLDCHVIIMRQHIPEFHAPPWSVESISVNAPGLCLAYVCYGSVAGTCVILSGLGCLRNTQHVGYCKSCILYSSCR